MPATNEILQEGRYRIEKQMPKVGECNVFAAYDTVRDTRVIVKEIALRMNRVTTPSQQEQLINAFSNQVRSLKEAKHDAILNVCDYFSEVGRQYLVMESEDGRELSDLLNSNSSGFSTEAVCGWADQLLDALSVFHRLLPPIVHKNINPGNIRLAADRNVKLLGFSLIDGSDTRVNIGTSGEAEEGDIAYLPLEQIWENLDSASQKVISSSYSEQEEREMLAPLDARSDVFSLGATLYHLLTGKKPIDALERSIEVLDGKADPLKPACDVNPRIPVAVSAIVMRAMRIKRNERFSSADEMRKALLATGILKVAHTPATVTPSAPPELPALPVTKPVIANAPVISNAVPNSEVSPAKIPIVTSLTPDPVAAESELLEMPKAPSPTLDDFHSVLTVDHDGADQTARYEATVSAPESTDQNEFVAASQDEEPFSFESAPKGFSLPIPAIVGGFVLILVIAISGWFFLSSGSGTTGRQFETQLSAQPTQQQETPAASTETQTVAVPADQPTETLAVPENAADQSVQSVKASKPAPAKSTKPNADAPKQPEKKKALTVDDLINDNK